MPPGDPPAAPAEAPSPTGPGATQPLPKSPPPACQGQASSGGGSPSGKGGPPAGTGPFQRDPENRAWHQENWNADPKKAHPGARALGDPEIYDKADQASAARYNEARSQGKDDQGARQESWDEWWKQVRSGRQASGSAGQTQVMAGAGAMARNHR